MAEFSDLEFFYYALIAIGAGALIGLEREHHRDEVSVIAGVRTFALISLLGFITSYLVSTGLEMGWLIVAGLLIVGAYGLFLGYIKFQKGSPGITTPMAMIVTYFTGVMLGYDLVFEAAVLTVATTFLLVSRRRTHRFASILHDDELIGALQFLTVAVILYPLTYDLNLSSPYDIFNKGQLLDLNYMLLLVLFVSGISFLSFVAIRKEGARRGLEFSGLLGGLVNSAATTASLSNIVKDKNDLVRSAVSGIVLATGVMFMRDLIIVMAADPSMEVAMLLWPFLGMATLVSMFLGIWKLSDGQESHEIQVKSPFAFRPAIKFVILIVIISAASELIGEYFGDSWVYVTAIGGLVSSSAVAASMGALVYTGNLPGSVGAVTLMIASMFSCVGNYIIMRSLNKNVEMTARSRFVVMIAMAGLFSLVLFLITL